MRAFEDHAHLRHGTAPAEETVKMVKTFGSHDIEIDDNSEGSAVRISKILCLSVAIPALTLAPGLLFAANPEVMTLSSNTEGVTDRIEAPPQVNQSNITPGGPTRGQVAGGGPAKTYPKEVGPYRGGSSDKDRFPSSKTSGPHKAGHHR